MSRANKNYDRLAWLKLVKVDRTLRPSVFKTAFEITQYVNVETGEFHASAKTIAEGGDWSDGIAMSASTVEVDMSKLEAAGFLECIKRGQRGRNRSSKFRVVLKSQPAGISKPAKIPVSTPNHAPENPSIAAVKSQPAGMNHSKNHRSKRNHSAATPRAAVPVVSQSIAAPDPIGRAFRALCRAHRDKINPDTATEERAIFDQLISRGHNPEQLIKAADNYANRSRGIDITPPFRDWLRWFLNNKIEGHSK